MRKLTDQEKRDRKTWRNDRSNPDAPKGTPAVEPKPPSYFSKDQKKAWREIVAMTDSLGTLAVSDLMQLEITAVMAAQFRKEAAAENPDTKVLKNLYDSLSKGLAKLGLTSVDRDGVSRIAGDAAAERASRFMKPPEVEDGLFAQPEPEAVKQ